MEKESAEGDAMTTTPDYCEGCTKPTPGPLRQHDLAMPNSRTIVATLCPAWTLADGEDTNAQFSLGKIVQFGRDQKAREQQKQADTQ